MPDKYCYLIGLCLYYVCLALLSFKLPFRAYCPSPVYVDYHVHIWFAWITLFCNLETMIDMVTITIS